MNPIKIGATFLNLDLVRSIRDLSTPDALGRSIPGAIRLEFEGGHVVEVLAGAPEFRAWLASRTTDPTPNHSGP